MKKLLSLMIGLMVMLPSCSSDEPTSAGPEPTNDNNRKDIVLSNAEKEIVNAEKEFAFHLFKEAVAANGNENTLVAPMSVYTCLSMMANGGDTQLAQQLAAELGASDLMTLNSLSRNLYNSLIKVDKNVQYSAANSAWADPSVQFKPEYTATLKDYYLATPYTAALRTQQGVDKVNAWVSENTKGLITSVLDGPVNSDLLIANINYFKGLWAGPFDKELTKEDIFHSSFGDLMVDMMKREGEFYRIENSDYIGAQLAYGNEAFRMTVLMSKTGRELSDFAASFNQNEWSRAIASMHKTDANLFMPRFKLNSKADIKNLVTTVTPSFTSTTFTEIANVSMKLDAILHSVVIEVDEAGTEAAAFTGGLDFGTDLGDGPAASMDVRVDRPFMFVIDEVSTGAILFMGTVNRI